jgi:hypothetical protein
VSGRYFCALTGNGVVAEGCSIGFEHHEYPLAFVGYGNSIPRAWEAAKERLDEEARRAKSIPEAEYMRALAGWQS